MDENKNKLNHIEKFRVGLCVIAFIIIIFILSSKSVDVKPDITMDLNPSTAYNYGNKYLGASPFFVTPPFASQVISFGQSMNAYNENLTLRNHEIFSLRDTFLNFLQVRKPAVGDTVYLTLDIKNTGNAFDSYADYILTDENDYILNSSVLVNYGYPYYNICKGQPIQIGPAQEKTLNIKINTQDFMNNGNYKVYVIFYNILSDNGYNPTPQCGPLKSQETFYAIIPFTLNQESSNLGIISYIAIIDVVLYLFFGYINQISKFAEDKNILATLNRLIGMIKKSFTNPSVLVFVILLITLIAIFLAIL